MKKLLSIAVLAMFIVSCNTPQPTTTTTGTDTATSTTTQTTTDTTGGRRDSLRQEIPGKL